MKKVKLKTSVELDTLAKLPHYFPQYQSQDQS